MRRLTHSTAASLARGLSLFCALTLLVGCDSGTGSGTGAGDEGAETLPGDQGEQEGQNGGDTAPVQCADGEVLGCDDATCLPVERQGDGECDDALNCGSLDYDGGDCLPPEEACADGEVLACDEETCFAIEGLGDEACDEAVNCEEHDYDGGDCADGPGICGDGNCAGDEDETSCPEDCATSLCAEDEILACDGASCVAATAYGDGNCDTALDCELTEFDGGDCVAQDPCGDGVCGDDEDAEVCPADCAEETGCKEGELVTCDGLDCVSALSLGNGICDAQLDCAEYDGDEGDCSLAPGCGDGSCDAFGGETLENCPQDCACDEDELEVCAGGSCVGADWIGDGICDVELSCLEYDYDGGDCELAECLDDELQSCDGLSCVPAIALGDGQCDGSLACDQYDNDSGDCDPVECDAGFILACDQLTCVDDAKFGDGVCDPELDCMETLLDNGDCAPVGECGDGLCGAGETCSSCPADCGPCLDGSTCCLGSDTPGCDDPECEATVCAIDDFCCLTSWDTYCVACAKGGPGYQGADCSATAGSCDFCHTCGDGICDANAGDTCDNCPEDCEVCVCSDGMVNGCDGVCIAEASLGNGFCDTGLNCEEFNADNGDCLECPEGEIASCVGTCIDENRLGDGTCDLDLQCLKWNFDEGDCEAICSDSQVVNCENGCTTATWPGDGICDAVLNCEEWNYDEGDCPIPCPEGEEWDCEQNCVPDTLFADGTCQPELACQATGWDGLDCEPTCSDTQVVNCDLGCTSATWPGDGICDSVLNCAEFNYDEGDCTPPVCGDGACTADETFENCSDDCEAPAVCGDGVCATGEDMSCPADCVPVCGDGACDAAAEDWMNCPDDCEAPFVCGDGACEEGEDEESCPSDCLVIEPCSDVTFQYADAEATEVLLSGDFNDWATGELATPLVNDGEGNWSVTVALTGGVHQYKFIVDGEWTQDMANDLSADDGMGAMNSVLYVSCGETIDVAGFWESNGGFTADISNAVFVQDYNDGVTAPLSHSVVLYDNDMNAAIVQSAWDDTFEIIAWTDIAEDGSWWYCQAVTGQPTPLAAFEAEGMADDTDPAAGGCGELNFAWNKMMPLPGQSVCEVDEACGDACVCAEGSTCTEGLCVADCEPLTECGDGMNCGSMDDGCGGTVSCGACGDGESCVENACEAECEPLTECGDGMNCGSMDDGCGGTVSCGTCGDGESCVENVCEADAPAPMCDPGYAGCTEEDFAANDMTMVDGPVAIDMVAFGPYDPKCLRVQVGQTVTIGAMPSHPFEKVCAEDDVMDSQNLSTEMVTFTMATPGYYNYKCEFHGSMVGNIHVVP